LKVELPFKNQKELNQIFENIIDNEVKDWTWDNYVKNHIKIWEKM